MARRSEAWRAVPARRRTGRWHRAFPPGAPLHRHPRGEDPETGEWRLTPARLAWLTASLGLVLAPHMLRIPVWMSAAFVLLAGWRLAAVAGHTRLPPRWVVIAAALGMLPGVVLSYGTVLGRDAGVSMLVFLAGLKLLETRSLRDAYAVSFLGFFLVITNFLYSQSIFTGVYMFAVVLLMTATLVIVNTKPGEVTPREALRTAAVLLLQAAPVMVVLFVLFPRVAGPLWGLPKDAYAGITGLTDSMSPGTISRVGESDAVAFRVRFDGPVPPTRELYWRGPVLWDTNGRTWTGDLRRERYTRAPAAFAGPPVDYTITLEPQELRQLPALDLPAGAPAGDRMTEDGQILAPRPVRERIRYHMRSYPTYRLGGLDPAERRRALALPVGVHPRARALARAWRAEYRDDAALVRHALRWFHDQPFHYTLHPPLLRGDTVDEFLFLTRRGFCEHFAAAFAVLMRAAGIPARVVTGFQGGELNPVGGYLVVRNRDAHAWVEVWLGARGWVREDPTAAVAPSRIDRGMDATLPEGTGAVAALGIHPHGPLLVALRRLRESWDALDNAWNQWVLSYGPARQARLLGALGLPGTDWRLLGAGLLCGVGGLLGLLAWWLARAPPPADTLVRIWERLGRKLARRGLARLSHEGPRDYARRVAGARPDLAGPVREITERYVALRYARDGAVGRRVRTRALRRAVARLRV